MIELVKLGLQRWRSSDHYRALQRYMAQVSIDELQDRRILLEGAHVLELGAGRGGYSLILKDKAKHFVACDFQIDGFFSRMQIPFCVADVSYPLPFARNSFHLVYASNLIEHVARPDELLSETWRVLKPGGNLYLSFPPFYSLAMIGGHNFKPFHFLGERKAISIVNRIYKTDFRDYATCYDTWGLYPLKISEVKQLILGAKFEILDMYTRLSVVNTARFPGILKDLATWHVCYIAKKR